MPGKDGFECGKELLLQDKTAKILLISSMKDEETILKAKHLGFSGYLQKPAEEESLVDIINKILTPDTIYDKLSSWSSTVFREALSQNITRLTKTTAEISDEDKKLAKVNMSRGITVVIGVIGMYSGIIVMDTSLETASKMTEVILKRPAKNNDEIISMFSEFANIIGGIACSMLNKKEKSLSLRVSPPSIFCGPSTEVVHPQVETHAIIAKTNFGDIELSYGFQKGSILWM